MKKTLIGAGVLMVFSGVLIFKGLRGLRQYEKFIEDKCLPEIGELLKKQNQTIEELQEEIDDYNRRLDEQIKETERLLAKLKDYEIDPTTIDVQIDDTI